MKFPKSAKLRWLAAGVAAVVLFVAGLMIGGRGSHGAEPAATGANPPATETAKTKWWTCSMHPQVRSPEPGKCPICGMALIPLEPTEEGGPRELTMSEQARSLAEIEVAPVRRQTVTRDVRMVGTIEYDETRQATITAWVGGRLDRLFVDYTGITVKKGDHMVWMYSPAILSAQEELIQAVKAAAAIRDSNLPLVRQAAEATRDASRDKLRLWGLTAEQIAEIEQRGTASDHIQINAPMGGVVTHKTAREGMYVETGTPIYQIADLSQLWVMLDAYESDLAWLHYGQDVAFTTEAYPGESFTGRISFIDPVLNERTRTVKVRVNVPNGDGRLKPGMFVKSVVHSQVAGGSKVMAPDLAGKYICPMHPEAVSDKPGKCPICGMAMVKAEELGYRAPTDAEKPLVIPATAPLLTGVRAVVYVQQPGDPSRFDGRTITLGPKAGDWYVVKDGLKEGELVVTKGAFKIDSALQILAKPSMMSGGEEEPMKMGAPMAFTMQLKPVFEAGIALSKALSDDHLDPAKTAARQLADAFGAIDAKALDDAHKASWEKLAGPARKAAANLAGAADLAAARQPLGPLMTALVTIGRQFGTGLEKTVYVAHCPMAMDNQGADWLQLGEDIENAYFGQEMYECGEITGKLEPMKMTGMEHEHHGQ